MGCKRDGRIVGADVSFYANAGCTPDESILVREIRSLLMFLINTILLAKSSF